MEIEICTVGGYEEVGKNMTALRVGDEVVLLDMGLHLERIISYEEQEQEDMTTEDMLRIGAVPNDGFIGSWRNMVKAIVLGHCHLDHLGAVPYLADKYKCEIIGTPYTIEILRRILKDKEVNISNKLKQLNCNSSLKISENIEIEFVNMTHSTLQTVMVVVHTPVGVVVYANDFKFDNHPVVGKKPNYKRLREIGEENVIALIVDSTRADEEQKTPSEKVARELLQDVLLGTENKDKAVIVTTFSSHIARLESILDFGRRLNRKVVFLGRSLNKYIGAAEKLNLIKFRKRAEIIGFKSKIKRKLGEIEKAGRSGYLIVCTGNQGEPEAMLSKLVNKEMPFRFLPGDHVIFSCRTIPSPVNIANREILEKKLKQLHVRIFTNIHTSGHCAREDLRDLIQILKPKHILPAHGDLDKLSALAELATEVGYEIGKNVHIMQNGKRISF